MNLTVNLTSFYLQHAIADSLFLVLKVHIGLVFKSALIFDFSLPAAAEQILVLVVEMMKLKQEKKNSKDFGLEKLKI